MTKKSSVYTRTGDGGMTSLAGGRRVPKHSARLEAYGTLDELNSLVGLLMTCITDQTDRERLSRVQCDLFALGARLAADPLGETRPCLLTPEAVAELEQAIDEADEGAGGWRGFVLPRGGRGAAMAHVCRTVCRRLERRMCAADIGESLPPQLLRYVNRLSDYFFVLAKKTNAAEGVEEKYWGKSS